MHFHDTYGQALTNTLAALADGVAVVDSSAGGLGGCPYAKSATGNLATEDLWALDGAGVETGVDLAALVETSVWMAEQLGRPSPSRVVTALAADDRRRDPRRTRRGQRRPLWMRPVRPATSAGGPQPARSATPVIRYTENPRSVVESATRPHARPPSTRVG